MDSVLNRFLLEDACEAIIDYRGKTPRKTEYGIPLITAKIIKNGKINFTEQEFIDPEDYDLWMTRGIPQNGDIVITTEAPLGEVAQLDGKRIALAQRVITLRGKKNILINNYLRYLLQTKEIQNQIQGRATGSTVQGIKQSELRKIILDLPSINDQIRISKNLIDIDNLIGLLERSNQILEKIIQTIFKSWFVDFDGQTEFVDSELGQIPKGWRVSFLGDIAINIKKQIKPSEETQVNYIGLEHIPRGNRFLNEWSTSDGLLSSKFEFKSGQILFGKLRSYFKKVGITPIDGICSTDILVIDSKVPHLRGYVLFVVSSDAFIDYTDRSSAGTRMPRTNWETMKKYLIAIPPTELLLKFNRIFQPICDSIISNIAAIRSLQKIRDSLLPKLMSGEIRVSV